MVSLNDIAKRAKVSVATVSNVLNSTGKFSIKVKERVMLIAEELNYRPNMAAKTLKTSKSYLMGIVLEDITVSFVPEIIDGIEEYAEEHGYSIILNNLRLYRKVGRRLENILVDLKQEEKILDYIHGALDSMLSLGIAGMIYVGEHPRNVSILTQKVSIPLVHTICYSKFSTAYNVNYADQQGAYAAVKTLLDSGHKTIGVVSGPKESESTMRRMEGYKQGLLEADLQFDTDLIVYGTWEFESGYTKTKELLARRNDIDALFVMSDLMAYGASNYVNDSGLVIGKDISIIGFDNLLSNKTRQPTLASVSIPYHKIGRKAAEVLLNSIEKQVPTSSSIHLSCSVEAGESVRKLE